MRSLAKGWIVHKLDLRTDCKAHANHQWLEPFDCLIMTRWFAFLRCFEVPHRVIVLTEHLLVMLLSADSDFVINCFAYVSVRNILGVFNANQVRWSFS